MPSVEDESLEERLGSDIVPEFPEFTVRRGPEVRTTSSTGGQKGVKPERYDLIPIEALAEVARVYGFGASKYAEHNWRKGYEWSKSYASMMRHSNAFWAGEDVDEETQCMHLASVVFHALTLMTFIEEQPQYDDRWVAPIADGIDHEARAQNIVSAIVDQVKSSYNKYTPENKAFDVEVTHSVDDSGEFHFENRTITPVDFSDNEGCNYD